MTSDDLRVAKYEVKTAFCFLKKGGFTMTLKNRRKIKATNERSSKMTIKPTEMNGLKRILLKATLLLLPVAYLIVLIPALSLAQEALAIHFLASSRYCYNAGK